MVNSVGFWGLDLSQVLVISAGFYSSEEGVSNTETINEISVADLGIEKEVESGKLRFTQHNDQNQIKGIGMLTKGYKQMLIRKQESISKSYNQLLLPN